MNLVEFINLLWLELGAYGLTGISLSSNKNHRGEIETILEGRFQIKGEPKQHIFAKCFSESKGFSLDKRAITLFINEAKWYCAAVYNHPERGSLCQYTK